MSRRRFIADEVEDDRAALVGAHAAHLRRVLRARVGQEFDVAAEGRVRRGRIVELADERVVFELAEEVPAMVETPVTLWLAVFKFDRMEWAIEKCTELGATCIVPLIAARTEAHLAAAAVKRCERWRRIAVQASEQSRRAEPPTIEAPVKFRRELLLGDAVPVGNLLSPQEGTRIVLAETEEQLSLTDALRDQAATSQVHLAVGPEGGWTSAERKLFADAGWIAASLGGTILRAETAAIAALAIVREGLR